MSFSAYALDDFASPFIAPASAAPRHIFWVRFTPPVLTTSLCPTRTRSAAEREAAENVIAIVMTRTMRLDFLLIFFIVLPRFERGLVFGFARGRKPATRR